jgi:hypothetical protein
MGVSDILGHAKEIAELVKKYNNMDLYQKIVDLRDEIFKLSEDNLTLKERVRELEKQQEITAQLTREGNVYWQITVDGKKLGPFCMACWDGDRKLINVLQTRDRYGNLAIICGRCSK